MQRIIITGNLGRDPEMRATQDGTPICNFSVGVRQGWGDRASSNWFRCTVFGVRSKSVGEHLAKGQKVTVIGELTIGEYQGKPQYDVRVDDVDWQPSGERSSQNVDRQFDQVVGREVRQMDRELREMLNDIVPF